MLGPTQYVNYAETHASAIATYEGSEKQTDAIGEGLAAITYALLDVAAAIRDHAEVMQSFTSKR